MRAFLTAWAGAGTDDAPYRPAGIPEDLPHTTIDFRPDASLPDGFCVVAVADDVLTIPGGLVLAADPREKLGAARRRIIANAIGLNIDATRVDDLLLELLTVHASPDTDRSRWNRLRPTVEGRHEIWLGNEKIVDLPAVAGGATLTESFDGGSGLLNGSGVDQTWTVSNGQLTMINNGCRPNLSGSTKNLAYPATNLASANHYAQAVVSSTSTSASARWGACVRHSTIDLSCYFGRMGGTGAWSIDKYVAGVLTEGLATGSTTKANGDVVKIDANGSTLTLYKNGTSLGSTTDTDITGNLRPGCFGYSNTGTANDGLFDTWEAGDLAAAPTFWPRGPRNGASAAVHRASRW